MSEQDNVVLKEIHRGEIFYLLNRETIGSEQQGGRPVVVVSNELNNKHSQNVTVVCVTTQAKTNLPTHVKIDNSELPIYGTILCETVQTVSRLRIGSYLGEVDECTMREIEKALAIQLDINCAQKHVDSAQSANFIERIKYDEVKAENVQLRLDYEKLYASFTADESLAKQIEVLKIQLIQAETKAQVYKELYDACQIK